MGAGAGAIKIMIEALRQTIAEEFSCLKEAVNYWLSIEEGDFCDDVHADSLIPKVKRGVQGDTMLTRMYFRFYD